MVGPPEEISPPGSGDLELGRYLYVFPIKSLQNVFKDLRLALMKSPRLMSCFF